MTVASTRVAELVLDKHPSERAYDALLAELDTISDDEAERINVEPVYLVNNMLGAMPKIMAMRSDVEANFKLFDLGLFDRFESYVLAFNHSHARYRASRAPKRDMAEQVRVVETRFNQLLRVVEMLIQFGFIDSRLTEGLKKDSAHKTLASDTLTLITILKEHWPQVAQNCPLTEHDLSEAGGEVIDLQTALGVREQAPALRHEAAVSRRKAFTLFKRAYEPIRRAALWLYGEAKASEVVPRLTAGQSRSNRRTPPEQEFDPEDSAPAPSTSASGNGAAAASESKATTFTNTSNMPVSPVFQDEE